MELWLVLVLVQLVLPLALLTLLILYPFGSRLADPQAPLSGNRVLLACGEAQVLLAHFRRGSLRVTKGQTVVAGQLLGEVGNSGRSDEPHLHVHVQRPGTTDARFSGDPLAATFNGQYLVRGQRITSSTLETRR